MRRKWIILIVIGVAAAGIGIYGWKEYHRTNSDLADSRSAYEVSAADLIKEFSGNDTAANKKYLGKIITVEGLIKKIDHDEEGFYTIEVGDTTDLSSVRCAIDSLYARDAAKLKPISSVRIKGIVTGFNKDELGLGSDVQLSRCVIEKRIK